MAVPSSQPNLYWLRCRLLETITAAQAQYETGLSVTETEAIYTGALKDTLTQAGAAVGTATQALAWLPWVIGGILALQIVPAILPRRNPGRSRKSRRRQ